MPLISLIVAASTNHVIGVDGRLPWHLRDDLQHFKAITTGKPIVMGRKTWASIGRPLPGRHNIVMTRRTDFEAPGCTVVSSKQEALAAAGEAEEVPLPAAISRHLLKGAQRVRSNRNAHFDELLLWEIIGVDLEKPTREVPW